MIIVFFFFCDLSRLLESCHLPNDFFPRSTGEIPPYVTGERVGATCAQSPKGLFAGPILPRGRLPQLYVVCLIAFTYGGRADCPQMSVTSPSPGGYHAFQCRQTASKEDCDRRVAVGRLPKALAVEYAGIRQKEEE